MTTKVDTEEHLVEAMKHGVAEIELELDTPLGKLVMRVKSMGPAVWGALLAMFSGGLITAILLMPPGSGVAVAIPALIVPLGGSGAAIAAVKLVKSARSRDILKAIREDYDVSTEGRTLRLVRRA